jgi:hypothetical protein
MRLLRAKSKPDQLLDTADQLLDTVGDSLAALSGGVGRSKLLKASLVAGGVAAITAGSAAVSSIRRRTEGSAS